MVTKNFQAYDALFVTSDFMEGEGIKKQRSGIHSDIDVLVGRQDWISPQQTILILTVSNIMLP